MDKSISQQVKEKPSEALTASSLPKSGRKKREMYTHVSHLAPILAFTAAALGWVWLAFEKRTNAQLRRKLEEVRKEQKFRYVLEHLYC